MARTLILSTILGTLAPLALADDFGMDWATVGDPGNRAANDDENGVYFPDSVSIGSVDYTYQMAVTEVTVGQYAEFAQAYAPLYRERTGSFFGSSEFTGSDFSLFGESATVEVRGDVSLNQPIQVGWEYAARYTNWLHNGKGTDAASFDHGVYDTSTFTQNPDGSYNHTLVHNDNASVWMADIHEWTKAAYWDPSKNNGEGGYWMFPNGSNEESDPYTERNNGDPTGASNEPLDVGSFPDVMSPWGILDMAGGAAEWSETSLGNGDSNDRGTRHRLGTNYQFDIYADEFFYSDDVMGWWIQRSINNRGGIRLARPIPTPGTLGVCGLGALALTRRRW